MVCGGPPCDPTFVLVVCCDAAGEFCAVVGLELFVLGAAGGRDVVVLENVGELLCDGRLLARVSFCGTARDGRAGAGVTAGICTGAAGSIGAGVDATGCCTTGAGAGSRLTTIKAIAVASTAPSTKVITGFISSPVC